MFRPMKKRIIEPLFTIHNNFLRAWFIQNHKQQTLTKKSLNLITN